MMRRELLKLVAAVSLIGGSPARGQSRRLVGILGSETANAWTERLNAFRDGLGQTGYIETPSDDGPAYHGQHA
jgi:hypothetical protein